MSAPAFARDTRGGGFRALALEQIEQAHQFAMKREGTGSGVSACSEAFFVSSASLANHSAGSTLLVLMAMPRTTIAMLAFRRPFAISRM